MLQHRVVQQLVRLRHLAVDEPGQVRGRVAAVAGAVQSGMELEVNLYNSLLTFAVVLKDRTVILC